MNDIRKNIDEMIETLKQERDELRVKLSLAKMEAGDEWEKIEGKMHQLESKTKELAHVTAESSRDIGEAVKLLGEEIRDGFKKIGKHL